MITCYKNLFDPRGVAFEIDIEKAFSRIKTGSSKDLLEKIRLEENKDARNELKTKLPCFLFSGTFSQRSDKGLIKHSGYICLDFDGFPDDETFKTWRDTLEASEFTMSVFTSPSGNGLKVIVKVPECDKEEHKLYFIALQKHFDCDEYFDVSCKNVSRVCYESFDPNIFVDMDSKIWTVKHEEEGYSYTERTPSIILNNDQKIIEKLLKWWEREFGFVEGNRNNNLFVLANAFNEYGIDRSTAEATIIHDIVRGALKDEEVFTLIRSAYKNSNSKGTKYFEDRDTYKKVETQLRRGADKSSIAKLLPNMDEDEAIELIDEIEQSKSDIVFWKIKETKAGKKVSIDAMLFKLFLENSGFFKYYPESADEPVFVYIQSNIVTTTSTSKIKDHVLDYLVSVDQLDVWNYCAAQMVLFAEKYLSMLEPINLKMMMDSKFDGYLYYQNGAVKVTKDNVELLSFMDCDGYIWADQIVKRKFMESEEIDNDFQKFVHKISADDPKRIQAMETTLGYLLHSFKDKTHQKAIIFNDEAITDDPNGGSGKSLVLNALGFFKKLIKIDGKTFDPNKGEFAFQRISIDTQVLAFDDVRKNFNFESLFSFITEGIAVNRKNKDEIYIPFERSPKIIITTNYVINGAGSSHDRRRHEIEFHQYFNQYRTPFSEFGRMLFEGWSGDEWTKFDNYMIGCLKKFLAIGLTSPVSINATAKRFIQNTSQEFWDWIGEENLKLDCNIYPSELVEEIKDEYPDLKKYLSTKKFTSWIRSYCEFKGYEYDNTIRSPKRGGRIITGNDEIENPDNLPF